MALLEARPYRPFKSSEEYLEAMKEDLAEWMNTLYPELTINAENFMDRLDTGVALCKHANYVRQAAEDYLARRQARNKSMTRSITSGSAGPILAMGNVHYLPAAKSGTFFARDNVSNFITWCRKSLKIIECLLFETDDLIMRKNEKHVILCLLEVARRGAKFGMLAPMLVQMERQIDREIAADNKANGIGCGTQTETEGNIEQTDIGVGTETISTETDIFDDSDTENDEDDDQGPMLMYGPQPQIITNDLKSLDEMVRDLVEKCTCPSQFPMVRVSEGKYRIGDTKVLIFVRILRSHVMVRVGGGWDTLSHYLDKHDPCRCKAQHRSSVAARLIPRANQQTNGGGIELHKAQVIFERSPPTTRKMISQINSNTTNANNTSLASTTHFSSTTSLLSPGYGGLNKNRSPSPTTAQRRYNNNHQSDHNLNMDKLHPSPNSLTSPNLARRSMSPSPRRLTDMRKKQSSLESYSSGPKSLPITAEIVNGVGYDNYEQSSALGGGHGGQNGDTIGNNSNKFENISDNGSEISDEGYRSLGVIQSNAQKRESLHSQASTDDAENNARHDQTSSDSQLSPSEDATTSQKTPENMENNLYTQNDDILMTHHHHHIDDMGPQSLPAVLNVATIAANSLQQQQQMQQQQQQHLANNKFEQSGVFITDDEITVDIATNTGLRKTGYSNKIFGLNDEGDDVIDAAKVSTTVNSNKKPQQQQQKPTKMTTTQQQAATAPTNNKSKIPFSPMATPQRRRSIDNSTCNTTGSLQDLHSRTALPVFSRAKPVYRSVRKPPTSIGVTNESRKSKSPAPSVGSQPARDVTNTWSGRSVMNGGRKRPTLTSDTFTPNTNGSSPFERNSKTRSSHILYDSNGRRIKGCTASLTTSPTKNHANSPLAQQLLEAASSAKNDAQILEKMKTLLLQYSTSNNKVQTATPTRSQQQQQKKPDYEDFTTAWVHSNGNLERSSSCSPPTKSLSKRSSAASSCGSTQSKGDVSAVVSPRRERGMSKIPAPVRQHTELY
ncbi:GAS2-like protein pickled eggs isoform 1-T2 [Cochliomyia hominivorax]